MMTLVARIGEQTGAPSIAVMSDAAALSLGPGRPSFSDYVRLRLFDEAFWADSDRRAVVGRRRGREIIAQINGAAAGPWANPLASSAYLAAFGFAVPEPVGVFALDLAAPGHRLLRSREQLQAFLASEPDLTCRPLFGTLPGFDVGAAIAHRGLGACVDRILDNFANGALFERRPAPAAAGRLRLVTVRTDDGPKLFRALWIVPDGRGGEVFLRLDARAGVVIDGQAGEGLELTWLDRDPRDDKPLAGRKVPGWSRARAMVCEASRVVEPLGLIGWDLIPTSAGPVICAIEPSPDLGAHQLADRRGVLNPEFQAFVSARRDDAALRDELMRA